jgi:ATP-dependent RNA helicase MRH4
MKSARFGAQSSNQKYNGSFSSPPLLPGLLQSVTEVLGPSTRPTSIQALALGNLFDEKGKVVGVGPPGGGGFRQFLLASETGSGKSIAYLLPMIQALKYSEFHPEMAPSPLPASLLAQAINPRGLILAPTHELARQLAKFAKSLLHNLKLRVLCASRANVTNDDVKGGGSSARMAQKFAADARWSGKDEKQQTFDVDILIGTSNKLLDMVRGFRWADDPEVSLSRKTKSEPEVGLARVEWVVIDEADVLFGEKNFALRAGFTVSDSLIADPDFIDTTKAILADISASRMEAYNMKLPTLRSSLPTPPESALNSRSEPPLVPEQQRRSQIDPAQYPFNLILTSATIPSSLAAYLDAHHPALTRLASPGLHKLPPGLVTEYEPWSGGNRWSDVEKRIRQIWAAEAAQGGFGSPGEKSKVLIFCNKGTTVEALGDFLDSKGVKNVALTSQGATRNKGNNHHLDGFLKANRTGRSVPGMASSHTANSSAADTPHVLITTSLLSRGLDFTPSIRHVLIPEPPRNMIDFLHRAGRSGRAGEWGRVIVFVKAKGRGSARSDQVQKAVNGLKGAGRAVLDAAWEGDADCDGSGTGSERGKTFASGRGGRKVPIQTPPAPSGGAVQTL